MMRLDIRNAHVLEITRLVCLSFAFGFCVVAADMFTTGRFQRNV